MRCVTCVVCLPCGRSGFVVLLLTVLSFRLFIVRSLPWGTGRGCCGACGAQDTHPSWTKHVEGVLTKQSKVVGGRIVDAETVLESGSPFVDPDTQKMHLSAHVIVHGIKSGSGIGLVKLALGDHLTPAYSRKSVLGLVGLANQGATCYLNSLLETLFHTRLFRRIVFEVATDGKASDARDDVVLALQRVFKGLQESEHPVETTELTRAFGWDSMDSFTQHDVQEMLRVLCDHLSVRCYEEDKRLWRAW